MPEELGKATLDTADEYRALLKVSVSPPRADKMLVWLKEKGVNAVKYRVLGSQNDVDYEVLKEAGLAKGTSAFYYSIMPWLHLSVEVASGVEGVPGQAMCIVSGG